MVFLVGSLFRVDVGMAIGCFLGVNILICKILEISNAATVAELLSDLML